MGIDARAVIGVLAAVSIIVIGITIMTYLNSINPLGAILGIIVLIAVAIAIVVGFARSHT